MGRARSMNGDSSGAYRVLLGKPEKGYHLVDRGVDRIIILK